MPQSLRTTTKTQHSQKKKKKKKSSSGNSFSSPQGKSPQAVCSLCCQLPHPHPQTKPNRPTFTWTWLRNLQRLSDGAVIFLKTRKPRGSRLGHVWILGVGEISLFFPDRKSQATFALSPCCQKAVLFSFVNFVMDR